MNKRIEILLVDDHQVVRDGLQAMLEQDENFRVTGQSADAESTMAQLDKLSPDIVLMDIKMPGMDGIELTRQVKQKNHSCNVIMLTLYDQYLSQALEAGARGYLLKDIKSLELSLAIKKVSEGQIVISESIKSNTQFDYNDRFGNTADESSDAMVEELQLVLSPPIEANQLLRLAGRTEETLQSRVLQMVGAWNEGTVMTVILNRTTPLQEVLDKFRNIPEIEEVGEEPLNQTISPKLLKKAESMPRMKNRPRRTLFVTLEQN
ncbi:MAG: response regulator [Dehalococcoidales bacterium]